MNTSFKGFGVHETGSSPIRTCDNAVTSGFAELERNLIAERTAAALRHKRQHGQVFNHTPLGFDRDEKKLILNAAEQEIVAQIRAWRGEGLSLHKIAAKLNAAGISGKARGRFYAGTIAKILASDLHA